jgi:sialate O-acetylesterase
MCWNFARWRSSLLRVLVFCLSASLAQAELRVAKIFSDHMVLQRDRPAPIWGWSAPREAVTVTLAGQTKRGTADAQGRWRVTLDPLPAESIGRDLTVAAQGARPQQVTIRDVLVGEVWFTAGQSNMMMGLGGSTGGAEGLKRLAACPYLRVANIPGQASHSPDPQPDFKPPVSWARPHGGYSAISGFFAEKLYRHLGGEVPVGMITAVAIVPAEAWVDAQSLTDSPALKHLLRSPLNMTSKWFNGVIAPLGPLALRGILYYQGEYNGGRGAEFQVLFPALIQSWRTSLEQPNLPFLFVQLPGFLEHRGEQDRPLDMDAATLAALHQPTLSGMWTDLREAQGNVWRSIPHTGMAVTIDVGEPYDIHPKQKEPVAERLLLSARQVAYGEDIEGSSPTPARVDVDGERFRVTFQHVGGGLAAKGGTLAGFDIAGEDLVLRPAQARIEGGRQVVVWHPEVKRPALLQYAWGGFPRCSLYNSSGLPATPFQHKVRDRIHAADAARFAFRNRSFEQAPADSPETAADWTLANGAVRTRERASHGEWSLKLPAREASALQNDIARGFGGVWNCDPLLPLAVRPGCVAAYSVDMAVTGGQPLSAYLRLCQNANASGYQFWGGVPLPRTASAAFVRRQIAAVFAPVFDLGGPDTAGGLFSHQNDAEGTVFLDNFSEVFLLRPLLTVSDIGPITLPQAKPGQSVVSAPRTVTNGQRRTTPRQLDDAPAAPVPTVLYGLAGCPRTEPHHMQRLTAPCDDVGAVILGQQAEWFEFLSEHRGATPQTLRLLGADGTSGLRSGPMAESESVVVRFRGADRSGEYRATLRIVTQAMNDGVLSAGQPGEPPIHLHYLDIPLSVRVGQQVP